MNVAIVSAASSLNTNDLLEACKRHSVNATVYQLKDLVIDTATVESSEFMSNDVYVFRGYNRSYHQAQSLAQLLVSLGKLVIDSSLAGGFVPSKLHEALVYHHNDIAHPRTYFIRDAASPAIGGITLPVVVKEVDSQKGQGVRLCRTPDELVQQVTEHGQSIIIQEYIDMSYDIRVLCVGGKVIGAIKRGVVDGDFRSNVSLGSQPEPYGLSEEVSALALKAHRAMGYDISGVDIGFDNLGTPFVIETNITPEWQGFKSATGVDVAEFVVAYIIEKYEHER